MLLLLVLALTGSRERFVIPPDLKYSRVPISDENNAHYWLARGVEAVRFPPQEAEKVRRLLKGEQWEDPLLRQTLQENGAAFEFFLRALHAPEAQVPEAKSLEEDFPYLEQWKYASGWMQIKVIQLVEQREFSEALQFSLQAAKLFHRLEGCDGTIAHLLSARALKADWLKQIASLALNGSLEKENLLEAAEVLDRLGPNVEGYRQSIFQELRLVQQTFHEIAQGRMNGEKVGPLGGLSTFYLLDLQETGEWYVTLTRNLLQGMSKPYSEFDRSQIPQPAENRSSLRLALSGNAVGAILYDMSLTAWILLASSSASEQVRADITRTILALQAWNMDHGQWPDDLEKLVPHYLKRVPVDAFDGKPLRYDPNKEIVYSVGMDLKDSGGVRGTRRSDEADIVHSLRPD